MQYICCYTQYGLKTQNMNKVNGYRNFSFGDIIKFAVFADAL